LTATRTRRILSVQPVAERGGSDLCLLRMVRDLAGAGWDCHIAMPAGSPLDDDFAAAGATVHVVPMRRITGSGSLRYWLGYVLAWPVAVARLTALARRIDAGVVHSNSLHSWYGWAVARVLHRPHVWHAREIVIQSAAALRLEGWLCRRFAWKVIAVSEPVAAQLPGADVVVIHDIPDPDEFSPDRAGRFRGRVGLSDEARLIGAAGRIDTWKGFGVVLDSVGLLRSLRPDAEVVVAGGAVAGKEGYASGLADRAATTEGVRWLGQRTDVPDLLADLDVFVLASTSPEPFSTVLAEALASGVPVVATDHGGSPEMLADAPPASCALVPPADPEALARAVVGLIPTGPSSVGERRRRTPMALEATATFDELFEQARLSGGPAGRRHHPA
jgi:glycosyltransferase involved in cell wall biosynthesis